MMTKPSLTIFVQNKLGGLPFYYVNLLRTGLFSGFDARYVVLDPVENRDAKLTAPLDGAPTEVFGYSELENRYHLFQRLAGCIPRTPGLVLTHFPLELGCLDVHRRPELTVLHVCHDEVYLDVARDFAHVIDGFVAHNPHFADRLKAQLPGARSEDVLFLPFGIPQEPEIRRAPNPDRPLRVVFIGRLHEQKGVLDLPRIDDLLRVSGVKVEWAILGRGPERERLERAVAGRGNFVIESPVDGHEMLHKAAAGDVFVLPTRLDGTPLAVMEAMSVGLVPVVTEFNPGAHWMVSADSGFVCSVPEPESFAVHLIRLANDRTELEKRSEAALRHAREHFDGVRQAGRYAEVFGRWRELKRTPAEPPRRYGGRFDRPWIPSSVTKGVRRLFRSNV